MKCSVKIDEKLQKELNEKTWLNGLIFTIIGAIGLGLYIIIGTFIENIILEIFLWVFAFLLAYGVFILILVKMTNKKSVNNNLTDEIELFEEYLIESTRKNDEVISTNKIYYKDLLKIRETENFLFLYPNKVSAVPISKKEFTSEEFSTIKLWVNSAKVKND